MNLQGITESYVGGQLEVRNFAKPRSVYKGEIESIAVEDNELRVKLAWNAKGEGPSLAPEKWVQDNILDYVFDLKRYSVSDLGNGKTLLSSIASDETSVLFPKGESRLELSQVEGLDGKKLAEKGE